MSCSKSIDTDQRARGTSDGSFETGCKNGSISFNGHGHSVDCRGITCGGGEWWPAASWPGLVLAQLMEGGGGCSQGVVCFQLCCAECCVVLCCVVVLCLGAVGSATPATHCLTAWG